MDIGIVSIPSTVDSLLCVLYKFSWILWRHVNNEIINSTKYKYLVDLLIGNCQTTKLSINETRNFPQTMKINESTM